MSSGDDGSSGVLNSEVCELEEVERKEEEKVGLMVGKMVEEKEE
jgi:hypothetical protein